MDERMDRRRVPDPFRRLRRVVWTWEGRPNFYEFDFESEVLMSQ